MHIPHIAKIMPPLSSTVMIDGQPLTINTEIATYAVKRVWNMSGKGDYHTAVLFDGTHLGGSFRKEYFRALNQKRGIEKEYKGSRRELPEFFNAVEVAQRLLINGELSIYREPKLEADDLVASIIYYIRYELGDFTTPIDIICNDADLLPYVDDQVSVYMRGGRTYNDLGSPSLRKYFQVTPESWHDYLGGTSAYKKYHIPFNSVVLHKLIRGDTSDEFEGATKGFGPKTYNNLMYQMEDDEVDFSTIFRYGVDFDAVVSPVLSKYFDEETVQYMGEIYRGMSPITSLDGQNWLYKEMEKPLMISEGSLQISCNTLGINLRS